MRQGSFWVQLRGRRHSDWVAPHAKQAQLCCNAVVQLGSACETGNLMAVKLHWEHRPLR